VHQPQHAEVSHLVLDVSQVHRDEQLEVAPQNAALHHVQRDEAGAAALFLGALLRVLQVPAQRHALAQQIGEEHKHQRHHAPQQVTLLVQREHHDGVEDNIAEVRGQRDDVEEDVAQRQKFVLGHHLQILCTFSLFCMESGTIIIANKF